MERPLDPELAFADASLSLESRERSSLQFLFLIHYTDKLMYDVVITCAFFFSLSGEH